MGTNPMDADTSQRLTLLRFPLIVGVVFIHAANGTGLALSDTARAARPVESAISFGFAAVSVPLFFLVSGFLFFQSTVAVDGPAPLDARTYVRKLKARARTLLVPYLFWNLVLAGVYLGASRVPALGGLTSGAQTSFVSEGPGGWLSAVLGIGRAPVVYQLWFIRNLMIAVLLVPLLEGLFRAVGMRASLAIGVLFLGVPWALHSWPVDIPNAVSLFFFFLGAWVGRFRLPLFRLDAWTLPAGALWALTVGLCTSGLAGELYPILLQVSILLGVVFVLGATCRLPLASAAGTGSLRRALLRWAPSAFFLFAVHEPLLTALIRVCHRVLGKLGVERLESILPLIQGAVYFGSVAAVCALSLVLHRWSKRFFPRLTAAATGGR